MPNSSPLVLGHRGAAAVAPENTLAGVRAAAQAGADGVEFDVQLSRDGVPVVLHDERLDRTTDGRGPVSKRTLGELKALDAGSWFSPRFRGERIPTLDEVLHLSRQLGLRCYVELKNNRKRYPGLETKVLAALRGFRMAERCWIASFNLASVQRVHRLAPYQDALWICSRFPGPIGRRRARGTVGGLAVLHRSITPRRMAIAERAGFRVFAWTVNEERDIRRMLHLPLAGIVSDDPGRVRKVVGLPH